MDDDVLRCPNCGSTEVVVTHDFPGEWGKGQAVCTFCRWRFSFTFEEEEQGQ